MGGTESVLASSIRCAMGVWIVYALAACNARPEPAMAPVSRSTSRAAVSITIRQLIDGSENYTDQTVRLTGKIIVECPEGCWFFMDDDTAKIYVDLKPAGLVIPQRAGSRVAVTGKPKGSGGNLQFLGEEVKFLEE